MLILSSLSSFGFEETKFMHTESLAPRQGSVVTVPGGPAGRPSVEFNNEKSGVDKQAPANNVHADMEAGSNEDISDRRLSVIHINPNIPRKSYWQKLAMTTTSPGKWSEFLRHSWQPFVILVTIPGVSFCCLTYAILLAWQTVMTTAISEWMLEPPYNFDSAQIGLMSLAPFIGTTLGSIVVGPISDWLALRLSKRNDGIYEPEMRFWVYVPFIPFTLAGAWWFGYSLNNGWSWVQVAVSYGISNFGAAPIQAVALTYMLDAYNGE
jgi:hypothetical protein